MRIEDLLKQLRREFIKVNLIQAALDTLVFFLSLNLVVFFLSVDFSTRFANVEVLASLSSVVFIADVVYRSYNYRLEIYEEENPELREVLRTARDNLDTQNVVSQALFEDVLERARSVTSDSIIPSKVIIQKILLVGVLSFLTVLSGIADLQVDAGGRSLFEKLGLENPTAPATGEGGTGNITVINGSDVYGEPADISVNSTIDFEIRGSENGTEPRVRPFSSAGETALGSTFSGIDEDLQLAKEYSLAIKNFSTG